MKELWCRRWAADVTQDGGAGDGGTDSQSTTGAEGGTVTSGAASGAGSGGSAGPPPPGAKPVGSGNYVVQQGECLLSIALEHGFLPETLWNLPENKEVKEKRKDPSVLLPGDRLHVPKPRVKQETSGDGQKHRFRRKGFPAKLRIRVLQNGEPRKDTPYILDIDGVLGDGTTDGDGVVEVTVPPQAKRGRLTVGKDESDRQVFELRLSGLDPIDALTGVQQRLDNLGFACPVTGDLDERTKAALADFQRACDLEVTGEADDKTRDRLVKEHGS